MLHQSHSNRNIKTNLQQKLKWAPTKVKMSDNYMNYMNNVSSELLRWLLHTHYTANFFFWDVKFRNWNSWSQMKKWYSSYISSPRAQEFHSSSSKNESVKFRIWNFGVQEYKVWAPMQEMKKFRKNKFPSSGNMKKPTSYTWSTSSLVLSFYLYLR